MTMQNQKYQSFDPTINNLFDRNLIDIIWDLQAFATKEEDAPRPLRERLFSLPWRPLNKTKTVIIKEPAMYSYTNPTNAKIVFICHPALKKTLMRGLQLSSLGI